MAVYFIESPQGIKVGYSESVEDRVRQLQTGNGRKLKLLAVIPNAGRDIEAEFHSLFARWRMEGEWFRAVGPIARTIALIRQGAAPQLKEHLQLLAEYTKAPRGMRIQMQPPTIVPKALRGTPTESVIRDLDLMIRDETIPQVLLGKAHCALRNLLRGKEFDTAFVSEYKTNYLKTPRAVPDTA